MRSKDYYFIVRNTVKTSKKRFLEFLRLASVTKDNSSVEITYDKYNLANGMIVDGKLVFPRIKLR